MSYQHPRTQQNKNQQAKSLLAIPTFKAEEDPSECCISPRISMKDQLKTLRMNKPQFLTKTNNSAVHKLHGFSVDSLISDRSISNIFEVNSRIKKSQVEYKFKNEWNSTKRLTPIFQKECNIAGEEVCFKYKSNTTKGLFTNKPEMTLPSVSTRQEEFDQCEYKSSHENIFTENEDTNTDTNIQTGGRTKNKSIKKDKKWYLKQRTKKTKRKNSTEYNQEGQSSSRPPRGFTRSPLFLPKCDRTEGEFSKISLYGDIRTKTDKDDLNSGILKPSSFIEADGDTNNSRYSISPLSGKRRVKFNGRLFVYKYKTEENLRDEQEFGFNPNRDLSKYKVSTFAN